MLRRPPREAEAACAAALDVLQGRAGADAASQAKSLLGLSMVGGLVQLQLCARIHEPIDAELRVALSRSGADRLVEIIVEAVQ